MAKYWINVVSRDHVERGKAGGFTQANHGKPQMLKRLAVGDYIVFYSPKTSYENGEALQMFTAVARIVDDELYQVEVSPDFVPWRRNAKFLVCQEIPVRPLIDDLDFIIDKVHWGHRFRFGAFAISEHDFQLLATAMQAGIS